MRRPPLRYLLAVVAVLTTPLACDEGSTVEPTADAGTTASEDGGTDGSRPDGGTGGRPDGATPERDANEPPREAGPDGEAPPVSQPGFIACGANACPESTTCCVSAGGEASCAASCAAGSARYRCDEANDCPTSGFKCWLSAGETPQSQCTPAPFPGSVQLCKTDGECPSGKPCTAVTCASYATHTCGGTCPE